MKFSKSEYDALPEALKSKCKLNGDDYILDLGKDDIFHMSGAQGLKNSVEAVRGERDEALTELEKLREQFSTFKDQFSGIDPARAKELLAQSRVSEEQKAIKAGEFEKLMERRLTEQRDEFDRSLQDLTAKYEAQLSAVTADREQILGTLRDSFLDTEYARACTAGGIQADLIPLIKGSITAGFSVEGAPGNFSIVKRNGNALVYNGAEPLSMSQVITEMVKKTPALRAGSTSVGARGNDSHHPAQKSFDQMTLTEQQAAIADNPSLLDDIRF